MNHFGEPSVYGTDVLIRLYAQYAFIYVILNIMYMYFGIYQRSFICEHLRNLIKMIDYCALIPRLVLTKGGDVPVYMNVVNAGIASIAGKIHVHERHVLLNRKSK